MKLEKQITYKRKLKKEFFISPSEVVKKPQFKKYDLTTRVWRLFEFKNLIS